MIFDTCQIVPEYVLKPTICQVLWLARWFRFGGLLRNHPKVYCNPLERIKNHQLALMILAIGQTFLIGGLLYFEIIPKWNLDLRSVDSKNFPIISSTQWCFVHLCYPGWSIQVAVVRAYPNITWMPMTPRRINGAWKGWLRFNGGFCASVGWTLRDGAQCGWWPPGFLCIF